MSFNTDIFISVFVILFLYIWYIHYNHRHIRRYLKTIPGPPGLPLLGQALELQSPQVTLPTFLKYTNEYGGIYKLQIGVVPYIVVTDYKFLEFILSSHKIITKDPDYSFFHAWLGTGLLTSTGQKWQKRRKALTPAFHFKILEQFVSVFENVGNIFVEKLKNQDNKDSVNVYNLVTLCTLDNICETAMGTSVNAQRSENSEYVFSVKQMCNIISGRIFSPFKIITSLYPLTSNYYKEKRAISILHEYTDNVIVLRNEERKRKVVDKSSVEDDVGSVRRKAFLDLLLDIQIDGQYLSHEDVREEVDTIMFEGHDTTASGISFAFYCLANHPHVQQKAFKEQQKIFGENIKNPSVTYQNLQEMKYLELVIKETLRLYPSVPYYGRLTTCDVEFDGVTIPKGLRIAIIAYVAHRNPKYYPDPEKFDPSRFENLDGKSPFAYLPFSAGPRNCIGQKFAMLEMKSTISKVLRSFELFQAIPRHDLQLSAETILKSANGIRIGIKERAF